jgi:dTDP-4-amino-4,6-dideoxygalactose transaminase
VAAGVGPSDEVVVPAFTFVATAEAVVHAGATPVLADVDPTTLLLTSEGLDAVRTPKTRAVLPVHLFGHVTPLDELDAWRADGLVVVEDAAQAHLASWRGRPVGTAGQAACYSFYPGKNLGALGDGGLVAGDEALVDTVRVLRDHGSRTKYEHAEVGWCSRLDGLQAALLAVKLAHLPAWTEARVSLAERYAERLPEDLLVPWEEGAVHHLLVVRVPAERREGIRAALLDRGVESGIHYPGALSTQPSMRPYCRPCPAAEHAASEVLSLPMDPLMTFDEVDEVAEVLGQVLRGS